MTDATGSQLDRGASRPRRRRRRTVLVAGYDGSSDSLAAVRWAAGRVGGEGRLVIVCAHHPAVPAPVVAERRARARAELEALWMEEAALADMDIDLVVADEAPAEALVHAAERASADAIVVGRHRAAPFKSDVVRQVLVLADRPVTVVPG